MKILYLGYPNNSIHKFLLTKGEIIQTQDKINSVEEFDWVISYGYPYIIKPDIIKISRNPIINLHISYLPFNRGADPNFWSWVDNTPKGVTIHYIDEGIDTGDILIQKIVEFEGNETLATSYLKLKNEIENLFIKNFDDIIRGIILPKKQKGIGSFHLKKDLDQYKDLLTSGWNTPVKELHMTDLEIIDEIEKIRNKNNVNWMDILRVAFKYAPEEARTIMTKINTDDNKISELLKQLSNNGKQND